MTVKLKAVPDQVMVVTGASSGIGLVTARRAAAAGARVMLVARDGATLKQVTEEIEAAGGSAAYMAADVGELAEVQAVAAETVARFGRIDTWVNNAAVAIYARLVDTPMAEHEALFRTNYFGAVHGALTAVEHLRQAGGALITVASIASDIPSPMMGAYAASKHALKGFVHSLRIELAADGVPVAVTLIKPSGIDTPIAEHAANHVPGEALIPAPVYDPEIVADAILDAAANPRRDVTVGGAGRAQALVAQHFPQLLEWLGGRLKARLYDPDRPKTDASNLRAPAGEGRERSRHQPGRRFSLYTRAARHPALVAGGAAAAGLALLAARRLSRGRSGPRRPGSGPGAA